MTADIAKLKALVERLRFPLGLGSYDPTYDLRHEAADRIEELEQSRDAARSNFLTMQNAANELRLRADAAEKRATELELTFTDERGTVWSPPTAEAYQRVCVARNKWQSRADTLEAALRPFADAANVIDPAMLDHSEIECWAAYTSEKHPGRFRVQIGDLRRARKALGDQP